MGRVAKLQDSWGGSKMISQWSHSEGGEGVPEDAHSEILAGGLTRPLVGQSQADAAP